MCTVDIDAGVKARGKGRLMHEIGDTRDARQPCQDPLDCRLDVGSRAVRPDLAVGYPVIRRSGRIRQP